MQYDVDLAIIGGGSAGLLAAHVAPKLGLKAALIERSRLGGDCLWTGCVPSKALIASAKAAHTIRHADRYGLAAAEPQVDTALVWQRIHRIQEEIAATDDNPEKYREQGVEVILDEATVVDAHTVRAGGRTLTARYILIATGSRPAAPPIEGLEETGYLTSESLFQLERAPRSLLVVGGGPIGVEMAQAMNRLGVATTLLELAPRILEREEPSLSDSLLGVLRDEGVDVHLGVQLQRATRVDGEKRLHGLIDGAEHTWAAEEIFVATGRKPNIESLGLDSAGVETNQRGVVVNERLQSSVKFVYAVGDCAGRFLFTHSAGAEAAVALRNMFYPGAKDAPQLVPWATFTDPELARVGMTADEARRAHGNERVRVSEWDLAQSDRGRTDAASAGRVIVVTDKSEKLLGAHILAPNASEMIGQFTLAIEEGVKLSKFADLIQVYPTFSSPIPRLAEELVYEQAAKPLIRAARKLNDVLGV